MDLHPINYKYISSAMFSPRHSIFVLLFALTLSIAFQGVIAVENTTCEQGRNCTSSVSSSKPADRDSVRRANRDRALKAISTAGVQLVLWGSERPPFYTGTRSTKEKAIEELNNKIMPIINSQINLLRESLTKDEFETTQAFELRQNEFEKQYDMKVKQRQKEVEQVRPEIYAAGFNEVLGAPLLYKVEYDADHQEFNLSISANQADYFINAKIKMPLAKAKETKAQIELKKDTEENAR